MLHLNARPVFVDLRTVYFGVLPVVGDRRRPTFRLASSEGRGFESSAGCTQKRSLLAPYEGLLGGLSEKLGKTGETSVEGDQ